LVHLAHAASADLARDFVRAEPDARAQCHGWPRAFYAIGRSGLRLATARSVAARRSSSGPRRR
jgi:hypothetical protein